MENDNKALYKYGSNKVKELNIELWNRINEITLDITFKEKFYLLENSLSNVPKCECGNSVKFIDMINGYRKFCSKKCMYDSDAIKNSRKNKCIEKWGVDNPSKVKEIRDKVKKTNIKKFGHEWATKSDDVKKKLKDIFIENLGVDNPSKVKEIRDKAKQTMIERFGVEHAMHSEDIKDKFKKFFIEKWGVDNPSKVEEIRDKAKQTMIERFGVEYALKSEELLSKSKRTMLERWGVDSPLKSKEILDKIRTNNIEKWGVDNPSKSEVIKEKIKNTILKKYGTLNLLEIDDIKDKIDKKNIEKWGVNHISKNNIYREKYKIANHPNYIKYIENGFSLFKCDRDENHNFEVSIDNYITRIKSNSTVCNPIGDLKSIKEKELYSYICKIYDGEVIQSYRDMYEIDIYLPKLKIGFEFNGLYWHSEEFKEKQYHINKTKYFKEKDIRIIHIWEDDWTFNVEIVKSQIKNWLNLSDNKIFARKCEIKLITDIKEIKSFLNENHIQGYVNNKISIGLLYKNELVGLMTFDNLEGRKKMGDGEWNLSRFCSKINTNIIGGSSKILNFFINKYNPKRIISYADRSWSEGDLYFKLGFKQVYITKPDYKYIVAEKRVHKSRYRKSNLKISDITEHKYTEMNNIKRIWDCGKIKFEMVI